MTPAGRVHDTQKKYEFPLFTGIDIEHPHKKFDLRLDHLPFKQIRKVQNGLIIHLIRSVHRQVWGQTTGFLSITNIV